MLIKEKLVIFIFIVSKRALNCDTGEQFSQSNNTISLYVTSSKEGKITNNNNI